MISTIRKSFKRGAIQVIVFITIASMLGADFLRRKMGKSQEMLDAAVVNGYHLPMKVFKARVREEERIINFFRTQFGENADIFLRSQGLGTDPQENVMKNMVREALLDSAADKIGIDLSSNYISKKLTDPNIVYSILNKLFPTLGITQTTKIDSQQLALFLKREGLTISEFEEILENEIKRAAVMDIVAGAVYVPNFVLEEKFAIQNKERKFAILEFKLEDYINKLKAAGIYMENQAREYFESQNKKLKKYWSPEKRNGTIWVIKPENYGLNISDKEIKDYLTLHKEEKIDQSQAKKALLDQKFKRLFEIDAKRIIAQSERNPNQFDEFIKNKKGIESKVSDLQSDSTLKSRAMFSLKQGQKIHYIDESSGVIVELNKIMPSHQNEFEKVKNTVLNDLYSEKASQLLTKDLEKYSNELKSKKLEDIIKEYQVAMNSALKLDKTDWLNGKSIEKYPIFEKIRADIPSLLQMTHKGAHLQHQTEKAGYIISVFETKPLDYKLFEKTKSDFIASANQEILQQIGYSFIASLNKDAKISYNPSFDSAA